MLRSVFVSCLALAFVFIAAKAALCKEKSVTRTSKLLLAVTAEDLIVAAGFGLVMAGAVRATQHRPRVQRWTYTALLACGAVAAAFAVVNVAICQRLGHPLNSRMFSLMGRFENARSSIMAVCTPWVLTGLVAAPLVYLVASRRRFAWSPPAGVRWAAAGLLLAWVSAGFVFRSGTAPDAKARRAGKSPHREIVQSFVSGVLFDRRIEIADRFPPEYLDDFRPARDRRQPPLAYAGPPPRNVILIVLESTAAQYLSLYGARYDTTPNLVAEASHALVFDRFYAHVGYTACSMTPLIFSQYPGLPWCYLPDESRPAPEGLAGILKRRGHRTAYFAAGDPEWEGMDVRALKAGFEKVFGPAELGGRLASSWGTEDGIVTDALIRWIGEGTGPFFATFWTDQTHDPYPLSADTRPMQFVDDPNLRHGQSLNRYLNAIRQADRHLGRLFAALRASGLADDTLVVITGDHGEAFGIEHDSVLGHGDGLFEENLRVPLMVWNPRLFPGGRRVDRVGGHVDLNPTLVHLLGIETPADWQGASLLSDDHPGRAYLVSDLSEFQFGVVDARHKYVLHFTNGYERLFDLREDPTEQRDLSKVRPDVVTELRGRVAAFVKAEEAFIEGKDLPRGPTTEAATRPTP